MCIHYAVTSLNISMYSVINAFNLIEQLSFPFTTLLKERQVIFKVKLPFVGSANAQKGFVDDEFGIEWCTLEASTS